MDWKGFYYDDVKKDMVLQNEMFPVRGYTLPKEKASNGIGRGGARKYQWVGLWDHVQSVQNRECIPGSNKFRVENQMTEVRWTDKDLGH